MVTQEEIRGIEEELERTKYNKHTQYHIGQLKAKLAKLKEGQESERQRGKAKGKAYSVKKTGDATVLLVGFPSVGKSTLLNRITNAESKIGEYDFTTLDVIPGILEYNSARIQILDIPGMIEGAASGKGRGKEILSVVRNADLVLIVLDKPEQEAVIRKELYNAGFRLDGKRPDVQIIKTVSGGVRVNVAVRLTKIDGKMVKLVLNERGIHNADILIRDNIDLDQLIDCTSKNRVYVPSITVFNKIDLQDQETINRIKNGSMIPVSSTRDMNIESLKEAIWNKLGLARVYLKKIGKEPDMKEPLIVKKGSTVIVICQRIHKEFAKNFEYARVWGSSKFPGQKVGKSYCLKDRDIVELHMK